MSFDCQDVNQILLIVVFISESIQQLEEVLRVSVSPW
jgi:hypothetical protein